MPEVIHYMHQSNQKAPVYKQASTSKSAYHSGGKSSYSQGRKPYNSAPHQDRRGSPYHARPGGEGAYQARPTTGGYRGGRRGGQGGGRGGAHKQFMDISKFVNKAVITEQVPHFKPEHSFLDFKIEEKIKANILKKGYSDPTPIQDRAIPHVLAGQAVVGIANTGTGKTAAFLIPLIDKVLKNHKEKILIMVPTRELATQIDDELRDFALM